MPRVLFFLLLLMVSLHGHAAGLSSQQIENYIASVPGLREWNDQFEAPVQDAMDNSSASGQPMMGNPYDMVRSALESAGLMEQFSQIVAQYGFRNAAEYFNVADRILRAYLAFQMSEQDLDSRVQEAMQELENANLPDAQKQQMMQLLKSQMGIVSSMAESDPADKAAVEPYLGQLDQAFDQ